MVQYSQNRKGKDGEQVKKFLEEAAVVSNEAIIPEVWKMVFHAPQIAAEAKPGQERHFCAAPLVLSMPIRQTVR